MKKGTVGLILAIIIVVIVGSAIYYVYNDSCRTADIKFVDFSLEASTSQTFLSDLLSFKKFKFTLQYDVLGGHVPVNSRDFTLNIKIEDLEIGSVELDDFQISGWWNTKTETILLDVSHLSYTDLTYIQNKLSQYKNELKVEVEGSAIINAIVTSKRVNNVISKYFLLTPTSVNFVNAYWEKESAVAGDMVDFHVRLSNPYRGNPVSGTLSIIVMEYLGGWGIDQEKQTYHFSVNINQGQGLYTDSFEASGGFFTQAFYLKVYWEGNLIYEMEKAYPPSLRFNYTLW